MLPIRYIIYQFSRHCLSASINNVVAGQVRSANGSRPVAYRDGVVFQEHVTAPPERTFAYKCGHGRAEYEYVNTSSETHHGQVATDYSADTILTPIYNCTDGKNYTAGHAEKLGQLFKKDQGAFLDALGIIFLVVGAIGIFVGIVIACCKHFCGSADSSNHVNVSPSYQPRTCTDMQDQNARHSSVRYSSYTMGINEPAESLDWCPITHPTPTTRHTMNTGSIHTRREPQCRVSIPDMAADPLNPPDYNDAMRTPSQNNHRSTNDNRTCRPGIHQNMSPTQCHNPVCHQPAEPYPYPAFPPGEDTLPYDVPPATVEYPPSSESPPSSEPPPPSYEVAMIRIRRAELHDVLDSPPVTPTSINSDYHFSSSDSCQYSNGTSTYGDDISEQRT